MADRVYNYESMRRQDMHDSGSTPGGPDPGGMAPDFDLPTIEGRRFRLREWRGRKPVFIEFGSIT